MDLQTALNGQAVPEAPPPRKAWGWQLLGNFMSVETSYDWLIPGVLERGDRVIVTGGEGHGKSTLLRQWAFMAAMGIHWFTGEQMPAVKVGLLDLENSGNQIRRSMDKFRGKLRDGWPKMAVRSAAEGLDILNPESDDAERLREFVHRHKLDLLVVGPLYKLVGGNENDNERAKAAAAVLDQVRSQGCAILMEAHNAKATDEKRSIRPREPVGASVWMRWPEYGLHLSEEGHLQPWRGQRGDGTFPRKLTRGGLWPWSVDTSELAESDPNLGRMRQLYEAIEREPGLSQREVMDRSTVHRNDVGPLLGQLIREGKVRVERKGSAHRHYIAALWPLQPGEQGYMTPEEKEDLEDVLGPLWVGLS